MEDGHPELGRRIRRLRREKRLSQEAFTHVANISNRHFQRIEKGEADLHLSTLYDIAARLEITGSELIDGLGPGAEDPPAEGDPKDETHSGVTLDVVEPSPPGRRS